MKNKKKIWIKAIRKRKLTQEEREGVFLHSFICRHCGLHFNVYSWQKNRHTAKKTFCPECGSTGNYIHFLLPLSDSKTIDVLSLKAEIFNHCPPKGSALVMDSNLTVK